MKTILKFIGKVVKVAVIILVYAMIKGLILTLLNGWIMLVAYLLLVATAIVLLTNKFKKIIRHESK